MITLRELRRENEKRITSTDNVAFKVMEFGASTKHYAGCILDTFVETITTNPMEWPTVQAQFFRFKQALRRIKRSCISKESKLKAKERITTLTKIEYLENELFRLQQAMEKMRQLTTMEEANVNFKENNCKRNNGSGGGNSTNSSDKNTDKVQEKTLPELNQNMEEEILDYCIPMPPALPSQPLYFSLQDQESISLYTRRLPPTRCFADAIKIGAALKLKKVGGPRSPGGTPYKKKCFGGNMSKNKENEARDHFSHALKEKFKHVYSPPESPSHLHATSPTIKRAATSTTLEEQVPELDHQYHNSSSKSLNQMEIHNPEENNDDNDKANELSDLDDSFLAAIQRIKLRRTEKVDDMDDADFA